MMNRKIIIKAPATTANLGPGFDSLGLALSLYNTFEFQEDKEYSFKNVNPLYCNKDNLIILSANKTYEYLKVPLQPFSINIGEDVPIARGLGSSATCIVSGIMAANYFSGNKLTKDEMLNIASSIEGHPDNVAPCFHGSLVSSFLNKNNVIYLNYEVSKELIFTILIPNFELKTSEARAVVPQMISIHDAVHNMSRAICIPKLMSEGNTKKLFYALDDVMHEPYRFPLIEDSEVFQEYSKKNNIPFCLSGSGSTLLFISKNSIKESLERLKVKAKWQIKELKCDINGVTLEEKNEK